MDDQNELNVEFPTSLVNFTVHLAQYEQLKTGEPGKDEIIYPNDLMEAISETAARDESYCHAMAGYFNSKEHVNSDPDIVRVSEFLALNTAMTRLHLIPETNGQPYDVSRPETVDNYYQTAKEHIGEIAEFLKTGVTWKEIFEEQKIKNWSDFKFFLNREDSYKMSYPDRYTNLIKHVFTYLEEAGEIPKGKLKMWLVGGGDCPELLPIIELLGGRENFDQILATDLYAPTAPFPMVKAIKDGYDQGPIDKMIMDPIDYLKQEGFHSYTEGVNICKNETIPAEANDIDIGTMFGVLLNIDGLEKPDKDNLKIATQNWLAKGKEGAIFMSVWLARIYLPINVMVLKKVATDKVDVQAIRNHPTVGLFFNMTNPDGSNVWSDKEIQALGISVVFPSVSEVASIQPGESWMRRHMIDRVRGAESILK